MAKGKRSRTHQTSSGAKKKARARKKPRQSNLKTGTHPVTGKSFDLMANGELVERYQTRAGAVANRQPGQRILVHQSVG